MSLKVELEKQANELLERARQQWPKPLSEEELEHLTEMQKQAWRRTERLYIDGGFQTLTEWIRDRDDKRAFARMYFDLLEHARTVEADTRVYVRGDWPPKAAAMETRLARELAEVDASLRAEWFKIRWGESIESYKTAAQQPSSSGCLVVVFCALCGLAGVFAYSVCAKTECCHTRFSYKRVELVNGATNCSGAIRCEGRCW